MYYEELKRWNQRWNLQKLEGGDGDANGGDGGNSGTILLAGWRLEEVFRYGRQQDSEQEVCQWEKKQAKKISEAEKLANMTAEQQRLIRAKSQPEGQDSELYKCTRDILAESGHQVRT